MMNKRKGNRGDKPGLGSLWSHAWFLLEAIKTFQSTVEEGERLPNHLISFLRKFDELAYYAMVGRPDLWEDYLDGVEKKLRENIPILTKIYKNHCARKYTEVEYVAELSKLLKADCTPKSFPIELAKLKLSPKQIRDDYNRGPKGAATNGLYGLYKLSSPRTMKKLRKRNVDWRHKDLEPLDGVGGLLESVKVFIGDGPVEAAMKCLKLGHRESTEKFSD